MEPITIKNIKIGGLGTLISTISTFLSYPRPVKWIIDGASPHEKLMINSLITCFDIPSSKLEVDFRHTYPVRRADVFDHFKFFSPYIQTNHIIYKDKSYLVRPDNNKIKPCVGVALYDKRKHFGAKEHIPFDRIEWPKMKRQWPEKKMWPIDINLKLISLLIQTGYDIITLDRQDINLDDKIFLLNEYCDFVVGYEGGLHHLAHVLNIPSIVLPWSSDEDVKRKNYHIMIHGLHIDDKTWFAKNVTDITLLNPDKLMKLRSKLAKGKGNNWFLNHKVEMSHSLEYVKLHVDDIEPKKAEQCRMFGVFEKQQITEHILNRKIGGSIDLDWF